MHSTAYMMQNLEKLDGLTKEDMDEVDIPVMLIRVDQDRMVTSEELSLPVRGYVMVRLRRFLTRSMSLKDLI